MASSLMQHYEIFSFLSSEHHPDEPLIFISEMEGAGMDPPQLYGQQNPRPGIIPVLQPPLVQQRAHIPGVVVDVWDFQIDSVSEGIPVPSLG